MADIATLLSCGGPQDSAWDELYKKYIEDRMIVLNGEIDVNTIEDIIMWVLWWNKEDQDIPVEKRKKIRLSHFLKMQHHRQLVSPKRKLHL